MRIGTKSVDLLYHTKAMQGMKLVRILFSLQNSVAAREEKNTPVDGAGPHIRFGLICGLARSNLPSF